MAFGQWGWNRGWRTQNGNSYLAGDELRHHDHRGRRNGPSDLEICQESGRSELRKRYPGICLGYHGYVLKKEPFGSFLV